MVVLVQPSSRKEPIARCATHVTASCFNIEAGSSSFLGGRSCRASTRLLQRCAHVMGRKGGPWPSSSECVEILMRERWHGFCATCDPEMYSRVHLVTYSEMVHLQRRRRLYYVRGSWVVSRISKERLDPVSEGCFRFVKLLPYLLGSRISPAREAGALSPLCLHARQRMRDEALIVSNELQALGSLTPWTIR